MNWQSRLYSLAAATLAPVVATAIALVCSCASAHAAAEAGLTPKEQQRLDAALARLEAQIPLTAADHTALKKAALARKVSSLRVCGDPGNLPLSDINRAGFQNKIIELLAEEMVRPSPISGAPTSTAASRGRPSRAATATCFSICP